MPQKRKNLNITGSNLWYLVGLITSDGCLSKDGRHINITSKEKDFLFSIKNNYNLVNRIGTKFNCVGKEAYQIQLANISLYEFLLSVGLTPCKSLTLKNLKIDEKYFNDFLRGLIDGDGCIRRWFHPTNYNQQWSLRIYSGSKEFIEWLESAINKLYKVKGGLYRGNKNTKLNILKYGKMAAREILEKCYYDGAFALERKAKLARSCVTSYKGWSRSNTVFA